MSADTIAAAGVTFSPSGFGGYYACDDCGGLVKPDSQYGIEPSAHTC